MRSRLRARDFLAAGLFAMCSSLVISIAAPAAGAELVVRPVSSFGLVGMQTRFGALEWRGGLVLSSSDERFGGLSGLALSKDGSRMLAVSDRGYWVRAELGYAEDRLVTAGGLHIAPMRDENGRIPKGKVRRDAEALAAWRPGNLDGKVIVGFESRTRIGIYDLGRRGEAAPLAGLPIPKALTRGPSNAELEALGRFTSGPHAGGILAVSEGHFDAAGRIRGWLLNGTRAKSIAIERHGDYMVTDLAILPGGDVITLERSFGASLLPGMALRRFAGSAIADGAVLEPELLFEGRAPLFAIDNMEGLAISSRAGETRLTIVSDDNYDRRLQRTLLLQFALTD